MRLSSEQISCRLMNICYLRSLFGYPNSMILYPLSKQNRPSAIRELVYSLEFPPSLITLARTVGLNDYKLKQGFQQVFNTTVFGYLQQQRLEKAKVQCKILHLKSRRSLDGLAMLVLVPSTALSKSIIVTSWERKAIQVERRATITKILKLRFGDIDASLEGIIPPLYNCPPMNIWIHSDKLTVRSYYRGFKDNRKVIKVTVRFSTFKSYPQYLDAFALQIR